MDELHLQWQDQVLAGLTDDSFDDWLRRAARLSRCERCGYDEADAKVSVPDLFADRYLQLCQHCADQLHRIEAKHMN